jgi:hypothetical protein
LTITKSTACGSFATDLARVLRNVLERIEEQAPDDAALIRRSLRGVEVVEPGAFARPTIIADCDPERGHLRFSVELSDRPQHALASTISHELAHLLPGCRSEEAADTRAEEWGFDYSAFRVPLFRRGPRTQNEIEEERQPGGRYHAQQAAASASNHTPAPVASTPSRDTAPWSELTDAERRQRALAIFDRPATAPTYEQAAFVASVKSMR